MKKHITFPKSDGITSRQAHCDVPAGTYEREFGKEGFFGPVSHLYHAHKPTGWIAWEGDLKPRAYDLMKLDATTACPFQATRLFYNAATQIRWWHYSGNMTHLVANGDGDDLLFVHAGAGEFFCDFGHLTYREGDYILLPRGLRWRIETTQPTQLMLVEATGHAFALPEKGLLGSQAIFDPAMLDVPAIDDAYKHQPQGEWRVVMKRAGKMSVATYPYNPLDVVGWHGDNLPVRINWRDLRPLMSHRYHLPPSAHTTFVTQRFVVCTFVPRPIESDPGALKVPFYHSNNDFDEIILYHQGAFFSRDNIHPGMLTLHPAGFPHGPHPKAFAAGALAAKKETDEVAVMIDTRDAIECDANIAAIELTDYVNSWKEV